MAKTHSSKSCDGLWRRIVKASGRCAICGRSDRQLHAHHLITKTARFFRHNVENGICLCARCHVAEKGDIVGGVRRISAHGTPRFFQDWLKAKHPEKYDWWEKNRHAVLPGVKIDYDQVYDALKNWPSEGDPE